MLMMMIGVLWNLKGSEGVRFVIDREECFSHDVKYQGDTVHVSFVVIKSDSNSFWRYGGGDEGVDLVVRPFSSTIKKMLLLKYSLRSLI